MSAFDVEGRSPAVGVPHVDLRPAGPGELPTVGAERERPGLGPAVARRPVHRVGGPEHLRPPRIDVPEADRAVLARRGEPPAGTEGDGIDLARVTGERRA